MPIHPYVSPAFTRTASTFSILVEEDVFIALLDSESYATDNAAYKEGAFVLSDLLTKRTPAFNVDYNGHYGPQIVLSLFEEDDCPENREEIVALINAHLAWCLLQPLVPHVAKRRKEEAA